MGLGQAADTTCSNCNAGNKAESDSRNGSGAYRRRETNTRSNWLASRYTPNKGVGLGPRRVLPNRSSKLPVTSPTLVHAVDMGETSFRLAEHERTSQSIHIRGKQYTSEKAEDFLLFKKQRKWLSPLVFLAVPSVLLNDYRREMTCL